MITPPIFSILRLVPKSRERRFFASIDFLREDLQISVFFFYFRSIFFFQEKNIFKCILSKCAGMFTKRWNKTWQTNQNLIKIRRIRNMKRNCWVPLISWSELNFCARFWMCEIYAILFLHNAFTSEETCQ